VQDFVGVPTPAEASNQLLRHFRGFVQAGKTGNPLFRDLRWLN
jgi:hypothetical protein